VWRRKTRDVRQQNSRGHRQAGADPEHTRIDGDLERADGEAGRIHRDHRDERPSQQHAQHGTCAAEHQALSQQRPPEGAMAGAERGPHGQLAFAAHRAGQDQVGDIRAGNDEHHRGCGEQHEQDRPRRRRNLIAEPGHLQLNVALHRICLGVLAHDRGVHRRQLGARGIERHARLQAAEELGHPVSAAGDHGRAKVMRAGHHVRDNLSVGRIRHRWLEDADHRGGAWTEADRLADHGAVAVE
jgi:hypothetical protein